MTTSVWSKLARMWRKMTAHAPTQTKGPSSADQAADCRKPTGWKPVALDGGYGWVVVFGSFMIHVFADGFVYSFGVIAESLVTEFKATNAETSLILSLLTGLMLAAGPIASAICNRIGCRITTIIGAIIASIGCAASYFADSMNYLLLSVGIVMGFGFGLMYCPAIVIVTMYFERYRSLATGVTVCGAGVGTTVFAKIIGFLIVRFSWRSVFLIYSGVVLLCIPCGFLYRPIAFEPIYEEDEVEDEDEKDERKDEEKVGNGTNKAKPNLLAVNGIRCAVSHTAINDNAEKQTNLQRVRSLGGHIHKTSQQSISSLGYLNVKDVFYGRSVNELKGYNEKIRSLSSLPSAHKETFRSRKDTHTSNVDVLKELPEEEDENEDSAATSSSKAIEMWRIIKKMLDFSLFADPIYVLFAVSNFLTSIGFNAPPMYMPMNAENVLMLTKTDSSTTVSAYGVANTLGRIVFGLVCDRKLPFKHGKDTARNRLWIYNLSLAACGLATCFVYAFSSFYSFTAYCFFFGFSISSYVCLTSVVLVDLVGVDRLTNAFGLLLLVQGLATFVGPPIAGKMFDMTGRYDMTFAFCGVCLFLSGVMMYAVPCLRSRQQQKLRLDEAEHSAETPMIA